MKVLLTGGSGQLARAIRTEWAVHNLIVPDESVLDLGNQDSIREVVAAARPEVVLNTGAFTQVDRCESEADLAMRINGESVGWLAEACQANNALLVQISTDYVFDGLATSPYLETDTPAPRSVYGWSKLKGEQEAARADQHLIVRTSWLYDAWGKNFLLTMLNAAAQGRPLTVVADQRGTPTTARLLARQLRSAVEEGWRGLVHGTCQGETTWYGFAAEIFRQAGVQADLSPCSTSAYPTPAVRPAYSVLDGVKRARLGTERMLPWEAGLEEVLRDYLNQAK